MKPLRAGLSVPWVFTAPPTPARTRRLSAVARCPKAVRARRGLAPVKSIKEPAYPSTEWCAVDVRCAG